MDGSETHNLGLTYLWQNVVMKVGMLDEGADFQKTRPQRKYC